MTILVNGGSDPRHIRYNGTYLAEVTYNGTTVWESFPSTIDPITVTYSNPNISFSLTDVTRVGTNIPAVGKTTGYVTYSASTSVSISSTRTLNPSSGKISFLTYTSMSVSGMHPRLTYAGQNNFDATINLYSQYDGRYFDADFTVAPYETSYYNLKFNLVGTLSDYGITPTAVITLNPTSFQTSGTFKVGARTWISG